METRVAVKTDFIELLTRLISESDDGDPPIQRTGRDLTCSQPNLGKWFDDCDFPFLMETLALSDDVFRQQFPGIKLSQDERQAFGGILETHCTECASCHAQKVESIEWASRIEKAFAENKEAIGDLLLSSGDDL
jgi:hypothetical protein